MKRNQKKMACETNPIGTKIVKKNKKGRCVTFKRVRKFGKGKNLCWKITENKKCRKSKKTK